MQALSNMNDVLEIMRGLAHMKQFIENRWYSTQILGKFDSNQTKTNIFFVTANIMHFWNFSAFGKTIFEN